MIPSSPLSALLRPCLWLIRPWLWFSRPLRRELLHPNPIIEFARWYRLAEHCFWLEFPDAVCLSTVDSEGFSDSRMVLLKDFDMRGFTFFTNCDSQKAQQIKERDQVSLTFFWDALQRQIRVQGRVELTSRLESDEYFRSRGRGSQTGAWASKQSELLTDRLELEQRFAEISSQFKGIEIPRPDNWGGYRVVPRRMEFWKARPHRLHDRFLYTRTGGAEWKIEQLYP